MLEVAKRKKNDIHVGQKKSSTLGPRSSEQFYIVTYYIKCVTTSGTDGSRGETKADAEIIMSIVDWSKQLSICWKAFHNSTGQEADYSDIRLN